MRRFCFILFFTLLVLSGLYLSFSLSWSLFYKYTILLHPALGVAVTLFIFVKLFPFLLRFSRHSLHSKLALFFCFIGFFLLFAGKESMFALCMVFPVTMAIASRKKILNLFLSNPIRVPLYLLVFLSMLTGINLFFPVAPTERFVVHRTVSFVLTLAVFIGASLFLKKNKKAFFLFYLSAASALLLLGLFIQNENQPLKVFSVNLTELLKGPPQTGNEAELLNISRSCGGAGCHEQIVKDHLRSTHFLSAQMRYIQNLNAMMLKENPEAGGRWCSGCHFPHKTFSKSFSFKIKDGISCVFCHSIRSVRVESLVPLEKRKDVKKGYDIDIFAHLLMFPTDANRMTVPAWNRFLIRLNRLGHSRVFKRPLYKKFEFCMPCHEGNIPPPEPEDVVRHNCVDCHMTSLAPFYKSMDKKSHLFLGGNLLIPFLLKDKEMLSITGQWLTGNFSPVLMDSFWELRKEAKDVPSRATWLILTLESLNPPAPGKACTIRAYTSNPGTGHPFPTGAVHLFDIWLDFQVETSDGKIIYKSGGRVKKVKNYFKEGVHRLGGIMLDEKGYPIEGPLFWKKKSMEKRWVEWGKTITDDFSFKIPSDVKGYIVVKAAWRYSRVNKEFSPYVFGKEVTFPAVTMASVMQKIRIKKQ